MTYGNDDEKYMKLALKEAQAAYGTGEVTVGAIVVQGNRIIASAHNMPISLSDPCAHAEILALRAAAKAIGNYRLNGATLYVTVEPCMMCCGGIILARLDRLVFGTRDEKTGGV